MLEVQKQIEAHQTSNAQAKKEQLLNNTRPRKALLDRDDHHCDQQHKQKDNVLKMALKMSTMHAELQIAKRERELAEEMLQKKQEKKKRKKRAESTEAMEKMLQDYVLNTN